MGSPSIVDEVFLDYPHDGVPRPSFVSNQDVLTFTLSGVSKISGLPQMKLAWIAVSGPAPAATAAMDRLEIIADTYLSMNAPIQLAAATLLGQRKNIQPQLLDRVRTNLAELDRQLAQQKACQRLQVEGGWYAVLRVPVTRIRRGSSPLTCCGKLRCWSTPATSTISPTTDTSYSAC